MRTLRLFFLFMTASLLSAPAFSMIEATLLKESEQLQACASEDQFCFNQIGQHFQNYQQAGRYYAFLYSHKMRTKKSALLIHSYTMSPYEMQRLGQILFVQGYNVVGIQLEAHRERAKYVDMKSVTAADWMADFRYGLNIAKALGEQPIVVGYSLGGLIATNGAMKYPNEVKGLALVAPALALRRGAETFACLGRSVSESSFVNSIFSKFSGGRKMSDYEKSFVNGACAIKSILQELFPQPQQAAQFVDGPQPDWREPMREQMAKIAIPVFMSLTEDDDVLDVSTIQYMSRDIKNLELVSYRESEKVNHLNMMSFFEAPGQQSVVTGSARKNKEFNQFLDNVGRIE